MLLALLHRLQGRPVYPEWQGLVVPVLRNRLLDVRKRAGFSSTVSMDTAVHQPDRRPDPEAEFRAAELLNNLSTPLTMREAECVRLRVEGLRYEEIAGVMGIRPGTVGALLARALKKLRKVLITERDARCLEA